LSEKEEPVRLRIGPVLLKEESPVGNLTKQDFIDRVASKADLSKREAGKAVDAFLDTVTESLKRGDQITFTGFGKFSTAHRAARMGVNPRNPGEKVHIPAATVPKFSAGSSLKQAVKSSGGGGEGGGY
jgi:DNA-binding protein HU-beta